MHFVCRVESRRTSVLDFAGLHHHTWPPLSLHCMSTPQPSSRSSQSQASWFMPELELCSHRLLRKMRYGVACVNGSLKRTWGESHRNHGDSLASLSLLCQVCNLLIRSLKHTLHAFVSILVEYGVAGSWDHLNASDIRTWAKDASVRAAAWLDTPKETLKEFRIPEAAASLFTNPLRLRSCLKFIRKRQAKVEASASGAPPILPVSDDQYFDDLASQRWKKPGHSGAPEPPTVIYRHVAGYDAPCIILGGLPVQSDMKFLRDKQVQLVVTCLQEHPEKKGGAVPIGAYVYQFGIAGKKRNASWEALRKLILPALENGESIYIHCMAGVHRAPVAAALVLAAVRQLPVDRMLQHIQKLRAIEPHKMIQGDVGEWVYTANVGPLPGLQVKVTVPFVTAKADGSLMHAVPHDWGPNSPAPACRWRQSWQPRFLFRQHRIYWRCFCGDRLQPHNLHYVCFTVSPRCTASYLGEFNHPVQAVKLS